MPLFHFNVYDNVASPDAEGTELQDWSEARLEAIRLAGGILRDDAQRIALGEAWHLEVTDETGLSLFRLDFTVTPAPAVTHRAQS